VSGYLGGTVEGQGPDQGTGGGRLVSGTDTRGSHGQYRHAKKAGTVTAAGKPSLDIPPGTLNAILKQVGLKK
jgi:hypothetical protein